MQIPFKVLEAMLGADRHHSVHPALRDFLYTNRIFRGNTLRSHLADLEVVLGLLLAHFLAIDVVAGGCILVLSAWLRGRPNLSGPSILACAAAWMIVSKLELNSLNFVKKAVEFSEPRPVHLALEQKRIEFCFRPMVALWWLAHAGTNILMAELFKRGASYGVHSPDVPQWFIGAVNWGILIGSAYASNTFLVLAAGALFPQERFLRWLWRLRLVLDALLVIGVPPVMRLFMR